MPLTSEQLRILELIAGGHTYDQILSSTSGLSYLDIFAAVQAALDELKAPAYSVSEIRETLPHAYRRWTPEDDKELERRARDGQSMEEMAAHFGRSVGAIQSRLLRILLGR
jgi:DNA-directed RNA polymerase specialized sigma24 family protein